MPSSIAMILNVSLIFSLCLISIKIPSPAFDNKPDITAPKLIEPLIKSIVKAIDTAQFGINPIKAVITGSRIFTFPNKTCNTACSEYTNIKKFNMIVIKRINIKILKVCFIG